MSESAQTPEAVALELLKLVAAAEEKAPPLGDGKTLFQFNRRTERKWILDTYAECLETAKSGRAFRG